MHHMTENAKTLRTTIPPLFTELNKIATRMDEVTTSDTTLRSHLVRRKDALQPAKQDGVVYMQDSM